jgi:dihydroorotate dehydrogenase
MGFNNDGAEVVAGRLAARRRGHLDKLDRRVVVGVNIGKTKLVPEAEAVDDYRLSTRLLAPHADYLVVNVSSPNTPGLRDLQAVEKLQPLLAAVRREALLATDRYVPLLVKIAPDLSDDDVLAVAALVVAERLDGIVATNTTISRDGLHSTAAEVDRAGAGGLSGAPLLHRSLEVLRMLRSRMGEEPTLIGVGGIATVGDAVERLAAGADLLQAYTALIYQGPTWPGRMNRALARRTEPALSGKDAR